MPSLILAKSSERATMPSHSPKQARLMAAAAHSPEFAKKTGVPMEVAKEFNKADTRRNKLSKAMDDLESETKPKGK
jgi:hypothetical protein